MLQFVAKFGSWKTGTGPKKYKYASVINVKSSFRTLTISENTVYKTCRNMD